MADGNSNSGEVNNSRVLTADDLVGILIHRSNQLASVLSVHGVNSDWAAVQVHVVSMYQDIERVTKILAAQQAATAAPAAPQPN